MFFVSLFQSKKTLHLCHICGKSFRKQYSLRTHMRRHNRDFNLECYLCKRLFILFPELRQHMRIHVSFDDNFSNCKSTVSGIKLIIYYFVFFIRLGRNLSNARMINAVKVFRHEPIGLHISEPILVQLHDHTSARCALKRLPGQDY